MFTKRRLSTIIFSALSVVLGSSIVFAQVQQGWQNTGCNQNGLFDPLCGKSLYDIANKIIDFLILIGGPIAAIMVLWGGFQIMTAAGDPEKFATGRKTIFYAAIGLVVILAAKLVVGLIQSIFQ